MDSTMMNDSIHGNMTFHPLLMAIIDTPQFQRLRNIKQLGMAYYVYPSAGHNRFEHSLGTCYLAEKWMEALYRNREISNNEKGEKEKEILCVQIAGLCHDIGHGPFSHLWEKFLQKTGINWNHEENSIKTLDIILEEEIWKKNGNLKVKDLFHKYGLKDEDIQLIKDLILGKSAGSTRPDIHYLYQIISNKDNDIDVDKFDYIKRDSTMLKISVSFDMDRIIQSSQIIEADGIKQICFRDKVIRNIEDMFMTRGALHDKAYQHTKVKIIEEMLMDALLLADKEFDFSSTDPKDILKLTDHIYYDILNAKCINDNLKKAKHLLDRISKRTLYFVVETVKIDESDENIFQRTLEKIMDELWEKFHHGSDIQKEDLGYFLVQIDMGKSNKNKPLEKVYVYGKENKQSAEKFYRTKRTTSIIPNLKTFLKRELIILYKGENQEIINRLKKEKDVIQKISKDLLSNNNE